MAEIILVRHGQASFGADNYDQLSELGFAQSQWLGEYLKQLDRPCDRVVMGSMARHRQTADGVLAGLGATIAPEVHPGLDEYDFQGLLDPLRARFGHQWCDTGHARRDYFHNMKRALGYWMSGDIDSDGRDSWVSFCQRIGEALDTVCGGGGRRTLVVTSGGPVSVILGQVLSLAPQQICALTLQIKNTSTSTLLYNRVDLTLDSFNDVGHLQSPEKRQHITFS